MSREVQRRRTTKKRMMISYENLSDELKIALKEHYPDGYANYITRVDKPNGGCFYGVMLETEDTIYFVKITVKVDNKSAEDIEKDLFAEEDLIVDEIKGADQIDEVADVSDED